ncbi:MAG: cytidine deaminase [Bacteroidales bacterium]|jgi:cytidine deaminase|nr:cytidine deaminase [Bacteroidales bacterium]MDI9592701.1 cytidine deaminase [Bacteroidota bacterium]OQC36264.1 MAG: Cytidine deaminase [Bacteroidetes bacterium ADurb.Bin041]MBP7874964.1 cytidine deaminase [Bacteroidales bacterium]MCO6468605.1 cytidine deaminase [Bacteroidales bacterium]
MEKIQLILELELYSSENELSHDEKKLLEMAAEAAENAYAPYSNYKVGAAIRLKSGKIVTANNQENAAYPSGLCAERVALFYASANFPDDPPQTIAIKAKTSDFKIKDPTPPCGACRQVMIEAESRNNKNIRVIMQGDNGRVFISNSIENLLPMSFQASRLDK